MGQVAKAAFELPGHDNGTDIREARKQVDAAGRAVGRAGRCWSGKTLADHTRTPCDRLVKYTITAKSATCRSKSRYCRSLVPRRGADGDGRFMPRADSGRRRYPCQTFKCASPRGLGLRFPLIL